MKIGIAQINTDPRRISENVDKIISYIKKGAEAGADLVVFPELAIPGYACMDLILDDEYVERNLEGLQKIASSSGGIAAIVGFIDLDREKIRPDGLKCRYNSAALVQDGKLVGITDKTLLPEYDVFSEKRYFSEARNRKIFEIKGHNVGVMICEDMWEEGYPRSVAGELCERGAQVLVNLSASPFSVGKKQKRASIIGELIHRCGVPFVYVNAVGSHDGYEGEIVFDGFSMVFDGKGRLGATGRNFSEDFFVVDLDEGFSPVACSSFPSEVEEIYGALVLGIRDYARRCGFKSSCLGLSGGIDSAVVCALAADALGSGNVTAINMPARYSSKETRRDARKIAENLGAMFKEIPIEGIFNAMESELQKVGFCFDKGKSTLENIQARLRGCILMAESNESGSLLLSTGNKTELALGYCTLYGDMSGGLAVISDVSKERVYKLASYINEKSGREVIPRSVIERAPTAELRDKQTDEESLGAPYSVLSPLVEDIIEKREPLDKLCLRYPKDLVGRISKMIERNEFKRRQAAPGIRITEKAFGVGRRVPMC